MISNRQRGLVELHGVATLLLVALFFWLYAEAILAWVPFVHLTREVNLLPYFLCVVIGMLVSSRQLAKIGARLSQLSGGEAAALAAQQVALVALVVFSMMFATQDRSISRLFLGTLLVWCWLLLVVLHLRLPRLLARIVFGRTSRVPTLFIGQADRLPRFQEWVSSRAQVGLEAVGFLSFNGAATPGTPGYLGSVAQLPELLGKMSIGQIVMLELPRDAEQARQILNLCQERGCRLLIHHDIDERLDHPLMVVEEDGHQFLTLHDEPLEEPLNRVLKRVFDIVVALPLVMFVLPPLSVCVWLVQRWQSPGPLLHIRARSGEQRMPFHMLKFRTMQIAPPDEKAEASQASASDVRIYPFGHFLRRHSLDEFPQFWNVLTGEMSIVGPRPVMPLLDAEFERLVRSYRSKHWVKPGITGLAQSRGFRGEIKTDEQLQERLRLDLYYIAHWSIWLDAQITLRTFWQVFFPPKSAY